MDASLFVPPACLKHFFLHSVIPSMILDSMARTIAGLGSMPITAEQFATTLENMSRAWEANLSAAWCVLRCAFCCAVCYAEIHSVKITDEQVVRSSLGNGDSPQFIQGSVVHSWYVGMSCPIARDFQKNIGEEKSFYDDSQQTSGTHWRTHWRTGELTTYRISSVCPSRCPVLTCREVS